jgi:probable rRNA maturation factor
MLIEWMDEREGAAEDGETRALMQRVMEQVLRDDGIEMETVVGVTFVDPDRIKEINFSFRRVDSVTDVLSFPMIEGLVGDAAPAQLLGCVDPETGALELGDLVICAQRAQEQAAEYGHSARRELGYLAAHGMLHLLGYDHETDEERAEMRRREEDALQKCCLTRED